jgi:hypothetical protein
MRGRNYAKRFVFAKGASPVSGERLHTMFYWSTRKHLTCQSAYDLCIAKGTSPVSAEC